MSKDSDSDIRFNELQTLNWIMQGVVLVWHPLLLFNTTDKAFIRVNRGHKPLILGGGRRIDSLDIGLPLALEVPVPPDSAHLRAVQARLYLEKVKEWYHLLYNGSPSSWLSSPYHGAWRVLSRTYRNVKRSIGRLNAHTPLNKECWACFSLDMNPSRSRSANGALQKADKRTSTI